MESISQAVGLNTDGHGICFSLPLNNIIGLGAHIDNINEL